MQTVNICLGEDAALPCHLVQLDAVVTLLAEFFNGDLELRIDFVDDCARAAGALVVHRWNLLLAPALFVVFENDNLGVLTAEFDDRIHFWVEFLYRE